MNTRRVRKNNFLCVYAVLFFSFICNISFLVAGFPGDMLVNTPQGFVAIKYLNIGDKVICLKNGYQKSEKIIIGKQKSITNSLLKIVTNDGASMYVAPESKFYSFQEKQWVLAEKLRGGHTILRQNFDFLVIKGIEKIESHSEVFDISVQKYHNFGITQNAFLVHNMNIGLRLLAKVFDYVKNHPKETAHFLMKAANIVVKRIHDNDQSRSPKKDSASKENLPSEKNDNSSDKKNEKQEKNDKHVPPSMSEEMLYQCILSGEIVLLDEFDLPNNLDGVKKSEKKENNENAHNEPIENDSTFPEISNQNNTEVKKGTEKTPPSLPQQKRQPITQSPKYQFSSGSFALDFTNFITSIPLKILDEICNGSENREKAREKERKINEQRNRELYPNPSPHIVFDWGVDYSGSKYNPGFKPIIRGYKPAPININQLNSSREYEAICQKYLVEDYNPKPEPKQSPGITPSRAGAGMMVSNKPKDFLFDKNFQNSENGKKYLAYSEYGPNGLNGNLSNTSSKTPKLYCNGVELDNKVAQRLGIMLGHISPNQNFWKYDLNSGPIFFDIPNFPLPQKKEPEKKVIPQKDSDGIFKSTTDDIILVGDAFRSIKDIITTGRDLINWYNDDSEKAPANLFKREEKKPKQKTESFKKNNNGNPCPCLCGCPCKPEFSCNCFCGCGKNNNRNMNKNQKKIEDEKNRKKNEIHCSEFFESIRDDYEKCGKKMYRIKKGKKGYGGAHYLYWDHLHGEVEAFGEGGNHIGALDPKTKKLYKPGILERMFPGINY